MNPYEQKQEERRARYEERAEQAKAEAQRRFTADNAIVGAIPMGQPILVGHHSERRHRRDLARAEAHRRAGVEALDKAEYYERKAAGVGRAGVSSDDPEAVGKLREKLAHLEANQAKMIAVNKCVRKNDREGLRALGLTEQAIEGAFTPDFCGRSGFPSYALTNNSGNMRRIRERIAQLEANAGRETKETEIAPAVGAPGLRVVQNAEANRVQLFFDAKPSEEVRSEMKARGFRWSPMAGAWQRHLNNAGIFAADQIVAYLKKACGVPTESYCHCGHGAPCMDCAE